MDQEKFDQHLMGYLFDELDEVTSAAMKRKIESDADCRDLALGLRATLDVAQLPIEEPSDDLEERILAAASLAQQKEPWSRKLLRSLSWAGSHAMRPQLAMAAMLVLVVGSSLLLLRVRTGAVGVTPTKEASSGVAMGPGPHDLPPPTTGNDLAPQVVERDEATPPEATASSATTAQPKSAASGAPLDEEQLAIIDKQFDQAMANYNKGAHLEAQRDFAAIKATKSPRAGSAALFEARAVRASAGCKAAVPYFNGVRAMGGATAADATWEQADCHRILGESAQAKKLYLTLENNKGYSARVAKELESQAETANTGGDGSSSRQRNATPKNDEQEETDEPQSAQPQPPKAPQPSQEPGPAPQQSTKK